MRYTVLHLGSMSYHDYKLYLVPTFDPPPHTHNLYNSGKGPFPSCWATQALLEKKKKHFGPPGNLTSDSNKPVHTTKIILLAYLSV